MLRPTMMAQQFQAEAYYLESKITVSLSDYLDDYAVHHHILEQLGVNILAISTDSVFAHKVFAETSPSAKKENEEKNPSVLV